MSKFNRIFTATLIVVAGLLILTYAVGAEAPWVDAYTVDPANLPEGVVAYVVDDHVFVRDEVAGEYTWWCAGSCGTGQCSVPTGPTPTGEPDPTPDTPTPTPTDIPEPTPKPACNRGIGNGGEGCDPGNSGGQGQGGGRGAGEDRDEDRGNNGGGNK